MRHRSPGARSLIAIAAATIVLATASVQPAAAASNDAARLVFRNQPAMTGVGMPVRTAGGARIRVAVVDDRGRPVRRAGIKVRLVLTGTTGCIRDSLTSTRWNGVALFRPIISCEGIGHRLRALHVATRRDPHVLMSTRSARFDILGSTLCGDACEATASKNGTAVRVSSATGNRVLLTVGGSGHDCPGYAETSEPATFEVTDSSTRTKVRMSIPYAGRPWWTYDVCFSSPASTFTDKSGMAVSVGRAGLLGDCHVRHHRSFSSTTYGESVPVGADPCVSARYKKDGHIVVVFSVPPGDPRARI